MLLYIKNSVFVHQSVYYNIIMKGHMKNVTSFPFISGTSNTSEKARKLAHSINVGLKQLQPQIPNVTSNHLMCKSNQQTPSITHCTQTLQNYY